MNLIIKPQGRGDWSLEGTGLEGPSPDPRGLEMIKERILFFLINSSTAQLGNIRCPIAQGYIKDYVDLIYFISPLSWYQQIMEFKDSINGGCNLIGKVPDF